MNSTLSPIVMIAGLAVVAVLLLVSSFARMLRKVGPNQALIRYGLGGTHIADGAVVYLSADAGTPEAVMAAMRCHRAWMMLGRSAMDDCPLDLPGIEVVAHATAGAIEVEITTRDASQVGELQRRVAKDVEAGANRSLRAAPR